MMVVIMIVIVIITVCIGIVVVAAAVLLPSSLPKLFLCFVMFYYISCKLTLRKCVFASLLGLVIAGITLI